MEPFNKKFDIPLHIIMNEMIDFRIKDGIIMFEDFFEPVYNSIVVLDIVLYRLFNRNII